MNNSRILDQVALKRIRYAQAFKKTNYIYKLAAQEIGFRAKIMRDDFASILEFGARGDLLKEELRENISFNKYSMLDINENIENNSIIVKQKFDLVVSNLSLHFFDNLKFELMKFKFLLQENGLLIFTIYGPKSLNNFRNIFLEVEMEEKGGVSKRFWDLEFADQVSEVVHSCGFKNCVVDSIAQEVQFKDAKQLHEDLKIMSDNSYGNNSYLGKSTYKKVVERFAKKPTDVFEIITISAFN